jgi:hypothetical protein
VHDVVPRPFDRCDPDPSGRVAVLGIREVSIGHLPEAVVESIDGLNFSNAGNVIPAHIALNPAKRLGFVDGPDPGVTQIQSFTY